MFMYIVVLNELYPIFLASGKYWSYEARARGKFSYVQCIVTNKSSFSSFRSNVNINDALGDYSLTLVDTLDTLVVSFVIW